MVRDLLIGIGCLLGLGCVVAALAMVRAGSLDDQQRPPSGAGRTAPPAAPAPDPHPTTPGGDAEAMHEQRVTPAAAEVEAHAATAGEPTTPDPQQAAYAQGFEQGIAFWKARSAEAQAQIARAEEQRDAAEARYTTLTREHLDTLAEVERLRKERGVLTGTIDRLRAEITEPRCDNHKCADCDYLHGQMFGGES